MVFSDGSSIWEKKSIHAFYPPPSCSLMLCFHLMNQSGPLSGFITQTEYWWTEAAALHMCGHRMARWANLELNSCFSSPLKMLDGNFPCTGLNACNAAHDSNFFLLPGSLGVHPETVCDFFYVFVCVDLSTFEFECVCVYMSREIYSCEHAGFSSICGSGHEAWIAQWLRSRLQSEVAPIRIQTTQAQHQA